MGWRLLAISGETLEVGGCSGAQAHVSAEAFLPDQWAAWAWLTCPGPLRAPFWMTQSQQGLASGDGAVTPLCS